MYIFMILHCSAVHGAMNDRPRYIFMILKRCLVPKCEVVLTSPFQFRPSNLQVGYFPLVLPWDVWSNCATCYVYTTFSMKNDHFTRHFYSLFRFLVIPMATSSQLTTITERRASHPSPLSWPIPWSQVASSPCRCWKLFDALRSKRKRYSKRILRKVLRKQHKWRW